MFRNWAGEMAQGKMVAGLSLITNMAKKNWLQQVVPGPLPHAITCVFYHLSACLSTIWLSVCLSAYISTYLSSSCINQSIIYLSTYLPIYLVYVCTIAYYSMYMEVKGQLEGVSAFLLLCGFPGLNSNRWCSEQASFPHEPTHQPRPFCL